MRLDLEELQKSNEYWDDYAFAREPLKKRISPGDKERLCTLARQCGQKEAKELVGRYKIRDPKRLCNELDVSVVLDSEPTGWPLIAAYFKEPAEISISADVIKRVQDIRNLPEKVQLWEFLFSDWKPEDVFLAHELFHYIESRKKMPPQTERVMLKAGPFSYGAKVHILSEIAGMAFAQELLQLPYCPFALDKVLLYVYEKTQLD